MRNFAATTNCYIAASMIILDIVAASIRVLHGPGLGPRAGPARSPWAGPGLNDILQDGPGAGLKLAGPGRARAGK